MTKVVHNFSPVPPAATAAPSWAGRVVQAVSCAGACVRRRIGGWVQGWRTGNPLARLRARRLEARQAQHQQASDAFRTSLQDCQADRPIVAEQHRGAMLKLSACLQLGRGLHSMAAQVSAGLDQSELDLNGLLELRLSGYQALGRTTPAVREARRALLHAAVAYVDQSVHVLCRQTAPDAMVLLGDDAPGRAQRVLLATLKASLRGDREMQGLLNDCHRIGQQLLQWQRAPAS